MIVRYRMPEERAAMGRELDAKYRQAEAERIFASRPRGATDLSQTCDGSVAPPSLSFSFSLSSLLSKIDNGGRQAEQVWAKTVPGHDGRYFVPPLPAVALYALSRSNLPQSAGTVFL